METSGSTVGRDAAGLSQSKRSTAAAAELVETLGAGEVETSSFGQAKDELTPGTFWGQTGLYWFSKTITEYTPERITDN